MALTEINEINLRMVNGDNVSIRRTFELHGVDWWTRRCASDDDSVTEE